MFTTFFAAWAAVAAQAGEPASPARPLQPVSAWARPNDYPAEEYRRRVQGEVGFELDVGADGRVSDCRITRSSGSEPLDRATCRMAVRARFEPARDSAANPVPGNYRGSLSWYLPGELRRPRR